MSIVLIRDSFENGSKFGIKKSAFGLLRELINCCCIRLCRPGCKISDGLNMLLALLFWACGWLGYKISVSLKNCA